MKKKQKKNYNLHLKSELIIVIIGVLLFIGSPKPMYGENTVTPLLINEAKNLFDREKQLIKARINLNWEKQHSLQHPDFRKKISVDELSYFEGWVAKDYREKAKKNAHISGSFVPTLDYIKKNKDKKDPLGFPVKRRYKWSEDPFLKINSFYLKKIFISSGGKYAKVNVMLEGRQRLNPAIVRGNFPFDAKYSATDYWEKINGKWVITLLSAPVKTSGAGIIKFFVPNNKNGWEKTNFIEINPEDLKLSLK
jgi:hypothetical protein